MLAVFAIAKYVMAPTEVAEEHRARMSFEHGEPSSIRTPVDHLDSRSISIFTITITITTTSNSDQAS